MNMILSIRTANASPTRLSPILDSLLILVLAHPLEQKPTGAF